MTTQELLGIAMGRIGISYDDFCRLTSEEFDYVFREHEKKCELLDRADWERMRILASIIIQPHVKKKLTPKRLLPLPWDKEKREKKSLTDKERAELFDRRLKECGWNLDVNT